jgi:hypothetical protein
MMRRGPLDRYPVEWVLRQAGSSRADGCIEFHGPEPMTVFLDGGQVTAIVAGISSQDPSLIVCARAATDEDTARAVSVRILSARLAARVGWYYHDPLEHGAVAAWSWGAASLLLEARTCGREDQSLDHWDERQITVCPTGNDMALGADAWAVVAAIAGTIPAAELRVRLGWNGTRLTTALEELDRSGALPLPGARPVHEDLTDGLAEDLADSARATEAVLAAVDAKRSTLARRDKRGERGGFEVDLTGGARAEEPRRMAAASSHKGPLTPPPVLATAGGDARGALRRLRSGRR